MEKLKFEKTEDKIDKFKKQNNLKSIINKLAIASLAIGISIIPFKKNEKINNDESEKIESIIGGDLVKEFKSMGFELDLSLESDKNNKYIIHIGQTHTHPGSSFDQILHAEEVSNFQEDILKLVRGASRLSENKVFYEGITEDPVESKKIVIELNSEIINYNKNGIKTLQDASDVINLINQYIKIKNHSFVRNYILKLDVMNLYSYLIHFLENYKTDASFEKIELNGLISITKILDIPLKSEFITGPDYFDSATTKLYMNDEIDILPAEKHQSLNSAHKLLETMQVLNNELNKLYIKNYNSNTKLLDVLRQIEELSSKKENGVISEEECASVVEKLSKIYQKEFNNLQSEIAKSPLSLRQNELKKEYERLVYDEREKDTLEIIYEYNKKNNINNHSILVFGSAHDFSKQLKKINSSNSENETDYGLITIKRP